MPARSRSTARPDPVAEFFGAWQLWLYGALVGALLAFLAYQVSPPDYRARATVVVDNNLEEAWQFFPDRQLFQFLQRETERLQELAWSDGVMQSVTAVATDFTVQELRAGVLQLSQPSDGGWHFYADASNSNEAQLLASTWAQAFVDAAHAAVDSSPGLAAARNALNAELAASAPNPERVQELTTQMATLDEQAKGISPYTELYVSQAADLPTERAVSQATYLLIGSVVGALAVPFYALLRPISRRKRL